MIQVKQCSHFAQREVTYDNLWRIFSYREKQFRPPEERTSSNWMQEIRRYSCFFLGAHAPQVNISVMQRGFVWMAVVCNTYVGVAMKTFFLCARVRVEIRIQIYWQWSCNLLMSFAKISNKTNLDGILVKPLPKMWKSNPETGGFNFQPKNVG